MKFAAPLILAASILAATACSNATPTPALTHTPAPALTHTPAPAPTHTPAPTYTPPPTYTPAPTYTPPPTYTPAAPPQSTARRTDETAGRFYDCLQNNPELFETLKSEIAGSFMQEDTGLPDDFAKQFIEAIIADRELFVWSFSELDPASPELKIIEALLDTEFCRR